MFNIPTYEEILENPYYSDWLKKSLLTALEKDPIEAMKEASVLSEIMKQRVVAVQNQNYEKIMNFQN